MSFPGPISISPINNTTDLNVGLRVNQRVTAQVLSVTGMTVVLEVDGHPVVAQLSSADQSSMLASQQTAQFIVTELNSQAVTLKLVKNEQSQPALKGTTSPGAELAERILENNNIPLTVANTVMTRSMLKQHLPVTPELLKELQSAFPDEASFTEADADLAAAMKAAGLPVTAQSLALASRLPVPTANALSTLIKSLNQALTGDIPEELLAQLSANLRSLNSMILIRGEDSSELANQLKAWVEAFGQSLENILLEKSKDPLKQISEKSLMSLVRLQHLLEQFGKHETARAIQEFLYELRHSQFMNVKPDQQPREGEWSEIGLMLQSPAPKTQDKFSSARLRIAHEAKTDSTSINPAYTRIILQVDVQPGETVEVDLSLVGRQIRTSVTASDLDWCEQARTDLPTLSAALDQLGYSLKDFQVDVSEPKPFSRIQVDSGSTHLLTVNIEV